MELRLSDTGDSPHMDGSDRYRIEQVGKPGGVAWVRLRPEHADVLRAALAAYRP